MVEFNVCRAGRPLGKVSVFLRSQEQSPLPLVARQGSLPSSPANRGYRNLKGTTSKNHPNSPGLSSFHNLELMEKDFPGLIP